MCALALAFLEMHTVPGDERAPCGGNRLVIQPVCRNTLQTPSIYRVADWRAAGLPVEYPSAIIPPSPIPHDLFAASPVFRYMKNVPADPTPFSRFAWLSDQGAESWWFSRDRESASSIAVPPMGANDGDWSDIHPAWALMLSTPLYRGTFDTLTRVTPKPFDQAIPSTGSEWSASVDSSVLLAQEPSKPRRADR